MMCTPKKSQLKEENNFGFIHFTVGKSKSGVEACFCFHNGKGATLICNFFLLGDISHFNYVFFYWFKFKILCKGIKPSSTL